MIYMDNASSTALHRAVLDAMLPWMTEQWGNPGSLHAAGDRAARAVAAARERAATLLGCRAREVYFTSGGSEADNQALRTAAVWGTARGRRHIVSAAFEHPAVLRPLEAMAEEGFEVTLLDPDAGGVISVSQVERALRPDTCLVSVMAVNNEVGTVQPAAELAALCRARGVLFHTDAVQAAGQLPLAGVEADLLTLSAHKFHGPKGIGALVCRNGLTPAPLIRGGGQERGCRAGTENVPAIVGLAAALEAACAGMEERTARVSALRDRLAGGLARLPGAHLSGDPLRRAPGIVHVCFEGVSREALLFLLDRAGICASAGSACTSGALTPSHVLKSMGVPDELARGALRLSLCGDNTEEEVDAVLAAVSAAVEKLRKIGEGAE